MAPEPLTPETVYKILDKKSVRGPAPPPVGSPEGKVEQLTRRLNGLRNMAEYRSGQMPDEVEEADDFCQALQILTGPLPAIRRGLIASLAMAETHGANTDRELGRPDGATLARVRADIEILDALVAAAEAAKKLPIYPVACLMAPVERWKGYAKALARTYREATGGSVEASYRFVAQTVPLITSEKKPTAAAVKIAILPRKSKNTSSPR